MTHCCDLLSANSWSVYHEIGLCASPVPKIHDFPVDREHEACPSTLEFCRANNRQPVPVVRTTVLSDRTVVRRSKSTLMMKRKILEFLTRLSHAFSQARLSSLPLWHRGHKTPLAQQWAAQRVKTKMNHDVDLAGTQQHRLSQR